MEDVPIVELRQVAKAFGANLVLQDIDLKIRRGELHCIIGQNGCGKSTLMKIICGVHAPEAGAAIVLNGNVYHSLSPHDAKREGVQIIFQDLSLFPNLTVAENIAFENNLASPFCFVSQAQHREVARTILTDLQVHIELDAIVGTLPIAQRQLVAICRALRADAKLIIMDEPTASLTRQEVNALFAVVHTLRSNGVTFVFISHRLDEIHEVADTVTVIKDGRKMGSYPASDMSIAQMERLMSGAMPRSEHGKKNGSAQNTELLRVQSLSKAGQYRDISFSVSKGEVLGIIGLLGSGRTELALTLFGMNKPDSGRVLLEGRRLMCASNRQSMQNGIAYVSEDRLKLGLVMPQSIGDNLVLPTVKHLANAFSRVHRRKRNAVITRWIEQLRIKAANADDPVATLSGGNQQRLVLAKWLATNPKLLILDSPTVGVDIAAKATIYKCVQDIARSGIALIIISDEVPEVYATADRILHMKHGAVHSIFTPEDMPAQSFLSHLVQ